MNLPLLVYRRAWSVMREFFKRFHSDDNCTIQENFALRKSARRKHVYQLVQKAHKDDVREFQENFFCFWTMKSWNVHPKEIMHSVSIDLLKNKWHEEQKYLSITLPEKCPYLDFFWSVFSPIRTEYGEILHISPYSVRMRENTDQKNSKYGHFSRSVKIYEQEQFIEA